MLGIFFVCCFVLWVRISESLPNFAGTFNTDYARVTGHITSRNISVSPGINSSNDSKKDDKVTINLSEASSAYQSNAKVAPNSVTCYFLIRY